jgi:hypothetical protein
MTSIDCQSGGLQKVPPPPGLVLQVKLSGEKTSVQGNGRCHYWPDFTEIGRIVLWPFTG